MNMASCQVNNYWNVLSINLYTIIHITVVFVVLYVLYMELSLWNQAAEAEIKHLNWNWIEYLCMEEQASVIN